MKKIIAILALSGMVITAHGYEQATNNVQQQNQSTAEKQVEVITVTGNRPIAFFRDQFQQAEQEFFALYNAKETNDEFKIECGAEKRSFSHVARNTCEPRYVEQTIYEMTQEALEIGSKRQGLQGQLQNLSSRRAIELKLKAKRKKHLASLRSIVEQNPDLQLKLLHLNQAKYALEKKRAEHFGEDLVSQEAKEIVASNKQFVEAEEQK